MARSTAGDKVAVLPSNSNMEVCPDNKPTDYTVVFAKPYDFGENVSRWSVGLAYVQFTQGWNNLRKDCKLRFLVKIPRLPTVEAAQAGFHQELFSREIPFNSTESDWDFDDNVLSMWADAQAESNSTFKLGEWVYYRVIVHAGYYASVQELMKRVSRQFELAFGSYGASLGYDVDYTTGFARFVSSSCDVKLFDGATYFADLLGLPSTKAHEYDYSRISSGNGRKAQVYQLELNGRRKPRLDVLHSMYIYSDIVQPCPVGNVEAPLMGIVPIGDAKPGHRVHHAFNPPTFLPLALSYIPRVRVKLCTDTGDKVPFASAGDNVVCGLTFRRKDEPLQPFVL